MGIEIFTKSEQVTRQENVTYSAVTCDACSTIIEVKGLVTKENVERGWTILSLTARDLDPQVEDWILCPTCTKDVKNLINYTLSSA